MNERELLALNGKIFVILSKTSPVISIDGRAYEINLVCVLIVNHFLQNNLLSCKDKIINNLHIDSDIVGENLKALTEVGGIEPANDGKYESRQGRKHYLTHYMDACSKQMFLDYTADGLRHDVKMMDEAYDNEIFSNQTLSSTFESEPLPLPEPQKISNNFLSSYSQFDAVDGPVSDEDLPALLKYTAGSRMEFVNRYGIARHRRFIPSGGNNHPTNVYIIRPIAGEIANCYYYDPNPTFAVADCSKPEFSENHKRCADHAIQIKF